MIGRNNNMAAVGLGWSQDHQDQQIYLVWSIRDYSSMSEYPAEKDWPDLLLSNRVTNLYCSDTPAAVDQFYAQVFQNYKYFTKFM